MTALYWLIDPIQYHDSISLANRGPLEVIDAILEATRNTEEKLKRHVAHFETGELLKQRYITLLFSVTSGSFIGMSHYFIVVVWSFRGISHYMFVMRYITLFYSHYMLVWIYNNIVTVCSSVVRKMEYIRAAKAGPPSMSLDRSIMSLDARSSMVLDRSIM